MSMSEYARLRDHGWGAMARGRLEEARGALAAARDLAETLTAEDPEIVDKADVNLAMIRLQLHDDAAAESGLRAVLLRTSNDDVARLAAHCLSKVLSRRGDSEKALRFARTSLERAEAQGEPLKVCSARQLIGHVLVNASHLEEGLEEYEAARALLRRHPLADRALHAFYETTVVDMIGYVHVLRGELEAGLALLEPALEQARLHDIRELQAEISGDICLAKMQLERLDEAIEHGLEMLSIGEELRVDHYRRNAFYLLGECCSRAGRDEEASEWYERLAEFYPSVPFLRQFLCEYDISALVNLKELS